jgi:large subunit ribosomal protein L4
MKINIYNTKGEQVGTTELPEAVFGLPWNAALVHQVVAAERVNSRSNNAHTKDRSEVSGGGKKPWRQKGTGRARHGSIRSPIWIGGGVTHGPRVDRIYEQKINKRMRRKALLVSLSGKARDGEVVVLEDFAFPEARTRQAAAVFQALAKKGVDRIGQKGGTTLVALTSTDTHAVRATQNLSHVCSYEARNLTTQQVLGAKYIVFPKASLSVLQAVADSLSKSKIVT